MLDYLAALPSSDQLDLKRLTLRTAMLLAVLTGQRRHALYMLKGSDIKLGMTNCVIAFSEKHKHSRPGVHSAPAEIPVYPHNPK